MAYIQVNKKISTTGRTYIRVAVTPKSSEGRTMLRQFEAGVKEFEKKWKATAAARKDRLAREARKKAAKKKAAKKKAAKKK
jgi:hypothetical protein